MTNEVIKVLMVLALYCALEVTLFSSSIASRQLRTTRAAQRADKTGTRRQAS
ncbi:hypothetical protein [Bradyrhizobium amphicarpaeae]|uniref:hypothetical protein n=1 Tax=Bradyrhizobium amphicarpaeae TaxID=1404768 RepID=UPI0012D7FF49|nr:hypothetical protein [Bradyrhizobium amphicarpaeae]